MNRVCIIGCPGAGKSTLSVALAQRTGLPLYHLDKIFWKPSWVECDQQEFNVAHNALIAQEHWIIDGMYRRTLSARINAADTVIFLDYSLPRCLTGALKRVITTYGRVRPDMAEGCPEKLDPSFLVYIWRFFPDHRPRVLDILATASPGMNLLTFRKPAELKAWMNQEGLAA